MGVLVKTIGIFAVPTVGGPTTGLNVSDAVSMWAKNAQKRFRMHCARPDFHVVRLLQYATLVHPKVRELQNQILEIETF